ARPRDSHEHRAEQERHGRGLLEALVLELTVDRRLVGSHRCENALLAPMPDGPVVAEWGGARGDRAQGEADERADVAFWQREQAEVVRLGRLGDADLEEGVQPRPVGAPIARLLDPGLE